MRLLILAHNLKASGARSVGWNVTRALPEVAPDHEYMFVVPQAAEYDLHPDKPNVEVLEVESTSILARFRLEQYGLPRLVRHFKPDWVWALGNLPLAATGGSQALLFHDPHLIYPQREFGREIMSERLKKALLRRVLRHRLPAVDLVFCQTETARARFETHYYPVTRTVLFPNAFSYRAAEGEGDGRATPPALEPYAGRFKFFVLTRYFAHKNLELIAEAYERYRTDLAQTVTFLTIDGSQHPGSRRLLNRIKRSGLEELIVNLGPLRQSQLSVYYRDTDSLLLPTLQESYSATYLEAMTFGRPILTSDRDFARELCGDAGLYFNPHDAESLKEAMVRISQNESERRSLVAAGAARLPVITRSWDSILRSALDAMAIPHG